MRTQVRNLHGRNIVVSELIENIGAITFVALYIYAYAADRNVPGGESWRRPWMIFTAYSLMVATIVGYVALGIEICMANALTLLILGYMAYVFAHGASRMFKKMKS